MFCPAVIWIVVFVRRVQRQAARLHRGFHYRFTAPVTLVRPIPDNLPAANETVKEFGLVIHNFIYAPEILLPGGGFPERFPRPADQNSYCLGNRLAAAH